MRLTLTPRVGLLLLLPACGALVTVVLFYGFLERTAGDAHFVNVAGRQRLLTEQMGAYARMVHGGREEHRASLRELVADYDQSLSALEHGGRVQGGSLSSAPAAMGDALAGAKAWWGALRPQLLQVAQSPPDDARSVDAYALVEAGIPRLLEVSDGVVRAFADHRRGLRRQMLMVLVGVAGFDLVLLFAGVWLSKRYAAAQDRADESMRVGLALQRVRNEVLQMESDADWEKVFGAFRRELGGLVEFSACGVNLVDVEKESYTDNYLDAAGMHQEHRPLGATLRQVLETGRYLYRRNPGEMSRFEDNRQLVARGVRSVVDVPFAGGTASMNSAKVEAFGRREIEILEQFAGAMAEAYRRVQDLKALAHTEQELRQAQKLEMIGQLAAGVAHEINNPLASVLGYAQLLLKENLEEGLRQDVQAILQAGRRAREIARGLLDFARRQKAGKTRVDLNPLVHEALALMRHQFEVSDVALHEELAEDLPAVEVHAGQIQQVVINLVQNSRDAIQQQGLAGAVVVRTRALNGRVHVEVEDDGPGIPDAIAERIFEPFFTTKEVGQGTGLGLSVCHGIARDHGGSLRLEKRERGACMALELPTRAEVAANQQL